MMPTFIEQLPKLEGLPFEMLSGYAKFYIPKKKSFWKFWKKTEWDEEAILVEWSSGAHNTITINKKTFYIHDGKIYQTKEVE